MQYFICYDDTCINLNRKDKGSCLFYMMPDNDCMFKERIDIECRSLNKHILSNWHIKQLKVTSWKIF